MRKFKDWLRKDDNWVLVLSIAIIVGFSIYAIWCAHYPKPYNN